MPCLVARMQAVSDGSLAALLLKVQSQPQILSAYDKAAPMRDRDAVGQLAAELGAVKVRAVERE